MTKPKRKTILGMRPWFLVCAVVVLVVLSQTSPAKRILFLWDWNRDYDAGLSSSAAASASPGEARADGGLVGSDPATGATVATVGAADAVATVDAADTARDLAAAALERTTHAVRYDPSYVVIDYPGGDVPDSRGVCSDVVVRAYRTLGFDLQRAIHEDMSRNFEEYPSLWRLNAPDPNIDHRRVPNLMTYFRRHGTVLPITDDPDDYKPGDIVAWDLGRGILHIGIVARPLSEDGSRHKIVHNIAAGPQLEDVLFDWKIIGHFRYEP